MSAMPRNLLDVTIAAALAALLASLILCGLFARLGDGSALLWTTRVAAVAGTVLIAGLACGHFLEE